MPFSHLCWDCRVDPGVFHTCYTTTPLRQRIATLAGDINTLVAFYVATMSFLRERRRQSGLYTRATTVNILRFLWVCLFIWCEVGAFFWSLSDCRWPDKAFKKVRLAGCCCTRALTSHAV